MTDDEFGPLDYEDDERAVGSGGRSALRVVRPGEGSYGLDRDSKGKVVKTVANAAMVLQRSPEWAGLRFNEFSHEAMLSGAPVIAGFDPPRDGALDDYGCVFASQWLGMTREIRLSPTQVGLACVVASKGAGRAHHPVREYLLSLAWDGVPRIDSWLTRYAGVEATGYSSAVGRMWLIAAVARVMLKRSICKTMLIFEGQQDAGKSTLLRNLCPNPEWFSDTPMDLGNKDQYQVLRGKWIVEIPELDGFRGKEATRIKSFVSSPVDNYRKSFGVKNEDVPRQCIFAGTTNEEHYFHDHTGNVRFWPVRVGKIDLAGVEQDRDQIWAEARDAYMDGALWHITDPATLREARAEQEEREEEDVWIAKLREWIDSPLGRSECSAGVTTSRVLECAVSVPTRDQDRASQSRIGVLMKKVGFQRAAGSSRPRKYVIVREE